MEIKFEKYKFENIRNQAFNYMFTSQNYYPITINTENSLFTVLSENEIVYVEKLNRLILNFDKKKKLINVFSQENNMAAKNLSFILKHSDAKTLEKIHS